LGIFAEIGQIRETSTLLIDNDQLEVFVGMTYRYNTTTWLKEGSDGTAIVQLESRGG